MDRLPEELVLLIASFLEPIDIVRLQLICTRVFTLTRDSNLWKNICFNNSRSEAMRRRQQLKAQEPRLITLREALDTLPMTSPLRPSSDYTSPHDNHAPNGEMDQYHMALNERKRAMANWEPGYEGEKIDYYQEYVHRHAPIALSWLQPALDGEGESREEREVTGMGTFTVGDEGVVDKVVGALDDGSVCVWDMAPSFLGTDRNQTQGRIVQRSASHLLSGITPSTDNHVSLARSKAIMTETGAVECVSIDSVQEKGYFAVQNTLNEVDLRTFQVAGRTLFPFPITAMSEAKYTTPITVGTNLTLHLHDPRSPSQSAGTALATSSPSGPSTRCELIAGPGPHSAFSHPFPSSLIPKPNLPDFNRILTGDPFPSYTTSSPFTSPFPSHTHAPLSQPGPLSIVHLPSPSTPSSCDGNSSIWVAGRFTSLLNYSRRFFPRLLGTIHSGARLSSLTSLPYPYLSTESAATKAAPLSIAQIRTAKSIPGCTLLAGGEYKGKGSLELYGLSSDPAYARLSTDAVAARRTVYQNRQTASRSKVLSVAAHGARIVFSDGDGGVKWVERDGKTVVREWNINTSTHSSAATARRGSGGRVDDEGGLDVDVNRSGGGRGLFAEEEKGDIIQKIVPLRGSSSSHPASSEWGKTTLMTTNQDNLLLWTGEGRLGMLGFSHKAAFEFFEDEERDGENMDGTGGTRGEEKRYVGQMRRVLERMGDEARFMRGLGLGGW